MLCFDRSHRRARGLHVEGCGRAAEQHRSTRANDLRHCDAGQHIDAVKNEGADECDGRDQSHQRHRDDFNRDTGFHAVQHVLAGVFAVTEIAGCRNRENRHRSGDEIGAVFAEHLHHLRHPRCAVLAECAGNHRFLRGRQQHVQAPGVGDLGLDVLVGRECRCEIGNVFESVTNARILDEVCRVRQPGLVGSMVENLQSARARDVVHVIAADLGVGIAIAVKERKG